MTQGNQTYFQTEAFSRISVRLYTGKEQMTQKQSQLPLSAIQLLSDF